MNELVWMNDEACLNLKNAPKEDADYQKMIEALYLNIMVALDQSLSIRKYTSYDLPAIFNLYIGEVLANERLKNSQLILRMCNLYGGLQLFRDMVSFWEKQQQACSSFQHVYGAAVLF